MCVLLTAGLSKQSDFSGKQVGVCVCVKEAPVISLRDLEYSDISLPSGQQQAAGVPQGCFMAGGNQANIYLRLLSDV